MSSFSLHSFVIFVLFHILSRHWLERNNLWREMTTTMTTTTLLLHSVPFAATHCKWWRDNDYNHCWLESDAWLQSAYMCTFFFLLMVLWIAKVHVHCTILRYEYWDHLAYTNIVCCLFVSFSVVISTSLFLLNRLPPLLLFLNLSSYSLTHSLTYSLTYIVSYIQYY